MISGIGACEIRHKADRLLNGVGRWKGGNALFGFHKGSFLPVGQGKAPGTAQMLMSLGDTVWSSQRQSAFPRVILLWGKTPNVRD